MSKVSRSFIQTAEPNAEHTWEPQPFWISCDKSSIFSESVQDTLIDQKWKAWNMPFQPLHTSQMSHLTEHLTFSLNSHLTSHLLQCHLSADSCLRSPVVNKPCK